LQDAGIQIPFPQSDLHLKSVDPSLQEFIKSSKTAPAKKVPGGPKPSSKKQSKKKDSFDEGELEITT